jgi:hypothetical protein
VLTTPLPLHRRVWRASQAFVQTPRPRLSRAAFEVGRINLSGTPWPFWQPGVIVSIGLAAGYLPVKYALARHLSSPRASHRVRDPLGALTYNDDEARFPTIRRREMPERTPIGLP